MGDECRLDAEQHKELLGFVMYLYSNSWENVLFFVGENCSTNKAFANIIILRLIGGACHCFNVEMKTILKKEQDTLDKIHILMTRLK